MLVNMKAPITYLMESKRKARLITPCFFNFVMYAGDITLFRSVQSLATNGENSNINFENEMNMELGNIGKWLTANKLSLNMHKYKYIIYSKSNKLSSYP